LFPGHPQIDLYASHLAISEGEYASAKTHAGLMRAHGGEDSYLLSLSSKTLAQIAALQGKLAEAERSARDWMETSAEAGDGGGYLSGAMFIAVLHSRFRRAPERGLKVVARALAKYPLSSLEPLDRPYVELANLYAVAGKPQLARATLAEYEQTVDPALRRDRESDRHEALGELSLAEGRPQNAIVEFRAAATLGLWCATCGLAGLGRAYKAAGESDSSIAAYERYVETSYIERIDTDAMQLAEVYKDLGELYAARNDEKKAALYYTRFTELWRNCDQELKPQVAEIKRLL
jgi:tetratricopeptide (TPR) repeat protein